MQIRKANLADVKGIAKVHVDSWRTTYKGIVPDSYLNNLSYEEREKNWARVIKENGAYIIEDSNGEIVGFASAGKERTGKYQEFLGELYAIYLLEEVQGKGLGRKLFNLVVKELQEKDLNSMLIWALEDNPACYFYEKLGGKKVDTDEIELGGKKLKEIAYGWHSTADIFDRD